MSDVIEEIENSDCKYLKLHCRELEQDFPDKHITFFYFGKGVSVSSVRSLLMGVSWDPHAFVGNVRCCGYALDFGPDKNLSVLIFRPSMNLVHTRKFCYEYSSEDIQKQNYAHYRPHITLGTNEEWPEERVKELFNKYFDRAWHVQGIKGNKGHPFEGVA